MEVENRVIRSCSFSNNFGADAQYLYDIWDESEYLAKYRRVIDLIKEPCLSCNYLKICRGRCHVISEFLTGNFNNPECPNVVEFQMQGK